MRVAVIGDPIDHSLSPVIHHAAFAAAGMDWEMLKVRTAVSDLPGLFERFRSEGWRGLSVTTPLKSAVAAQLDDVDPTARRLDSVNCVAWNDTVLTGMSTDGDGCCDALERDPGLTIAGTDFGVLGAGPAARSIIEALGRRGARRIVVVNRSRDRAVIAAELGGAVAIVGTAADLTDCDVVINATSVGMGDDQTLVLDQQQLRAGQVVCDIVYHPLETPLLGAARAVGAIPIDGLGMLVGQAARAFTAWTREPAPVNAMLDGVRRALT